MLFLPIPSNHGVWSRFNFQLRLAHILLRPGHISIRVLDLEAAVWHYAEVIGLIETARDDERRRVYLKGWDEHDHHSVVLREADTPGMDYMAFKVDSPRTLEQLGRGVEDFGCKLESIPAGEHKATGERIRFEIPFGHKIELYAEKDKVGNGMPTINPGMWPDGLKGMQPTRFDHCQLHGVDLDNTVDLFTRVLGFGLVEQVVDGDQMVAAFLSCSTKQHDIAFIRDLDHPAGFHHAMFYLNTNEEVLRAADIITMHDVSLDIGPTRHGVTRGVTIYFFDPSGNRNEVSTGGYIYYPDTPTLTWTMDNIGTAIFYWRRTLHERFMGVMT